MEQNSILDRLASTTEEASLGRLMDTLDSSIQQLRNHLDNCHELLKVPASHVPPEDVVSYAHRLRYAFHPLGTTPGLPNLAPAPQHLHMLASTLTAYHKEQQQQAAAAAHQQLLLQQQKQQQELQQQQQSLTDAAGVLPFIPPDWKPGDPIPEEFLAQAAALLPGVQAAGPAAATSPAAGAPTPDAAVVRPASAAPAAPQAATAAPTPSSALAALQLQFKLNEDLGEEVEEEFSEEFSDDD